MRIDATCKLSLGPTGLRFRMAKPSARLGRGSETKPAPVSDALRILSGPVFSSNSVSGQFVPRENERVSEVALLVDGSFLASSQVMADEVGCLYTLPLPGHVIGKWLDVVTVTSGRSVLDGPIDLVAARGLHWIGWKLADAIIVGEFTLNGPACPDDETLIPIEMMTGSLVYKRVFAKPVPSDDSMSGSRARTYRFSGGLPALPHQQHPTVITPRVGGAQLPFELAITARACGYVGFVDQTDTPFAQGWIVNLSTPKRRVKLELRIQGRTVASFAADQFRADIKELGLSDGRSSFRVPFPKGTPRDQSLSIEVVVAGTELNLCNSPYQRVAPLPYAGYFDALEGPFAAGWLVNMHNPEIPLKVEAICNGEIVGVGLADLYRGDVEKSGFPTPRCGFRFLLERPLALLFDKDIYLRIAGTDQVLSGSPRQISQNSNITRFLTRGATIPISVLHRLARRMMHQTRSITISIIMPVFNTPRDWLIQALNSVNGQWSGNWELICIDDGSTEPHVREVLEAFSRHNPRIRVLRSPDNVGIARATNFGLRAARGDYVAFMDHDDAIEPDAVYKLAAAAQQTGADLIYSDEALTTSDINSIIEVRARPAFSHDYYLSHPYFVHMICVQTAVARQLAGWNETLSITADVDFVLRVLEVADIVAHVPSVLYRWRTHDRSTGHTKQSEVNDATKAALTRHLARLGRKATVSNGFRYNEYRVDWQDDGGEVLVVIPTKNREDLLRKCINSIERTSKGENVRIVVIDHESTDPKTIRYLAAIAGCHTIMPYQGVFNYALMNNLAVHRYAERAKYVLFLNNDVEAFEPGWIARMRSLASRPEVGAVGPLLLYGDDRVQHAGVLMGFSGAADHAMKFANAYLAKGERHPGYNCNLTAVRDYSAVTAACMMVRKNVFAQVGGFDEKFVVGFNDTDLCLRIGQAGFKVLYDGFTVLYHHESATRIQSNEVDHPEDDARLRARWTRFFKKGDPFYSPLLAPRGTDHTLRQDNGCKDRMGVRAVSLRQERDLVNGKISSKPRAARRQKATQPSESSPGAGKI